VAAVLVIAATKQRRGLVEQPALQCGIPFGDAVDFLRQIWLQQVADGSALEFMVGLAG
jgi:hypothetical protein